MNPYSNTAGLEWIPNSVNKTTSRGDPRPCIVYTDDNEFVRYQIASFIIGKGWVNQFRDRVHNVLFYAYITSPQKETAR